MTYVETIGIFLMEHGATIVTVLSIVAVVVALLVKGKLNTFAQQTVSAVYRTSLHAAQELGEEGLNWLTSPSGVAYRRALVKRAYGLLPDALVIRGVPLPIALIKRYVTADRFADMVEAAFMRAVDTANKINDKQV